VAGGISKEGLTGTRARPFGWAREATPKHGSGVDRPPIRERPKCPKVDPGPVGAAGMLMPMALEIAPNRDAVPRWVRMAGIAVAVAAAIFVLMELRPDLLLRDTTANGGDTGAHVWWPWYFIHHLLPKLRLSGWSRDYYAGLPIGQFYFPVPALIVAVFDLFLPYNVAFKLVTVLGPVSLPIAAYVFARGIRAPEPAPPLFAVATLPYLFYTGYTIWGGNIASTLAGEFSFSIAISFSLVFLGLFARALDDRRRLALPALFVALAVMSHVIVAYFALASAAVLWLQRRPLKNTTVAAGIIVTGGLLTALWSLPLVARLAYTTDLGWTKETKYIHDLFPDPFTWAVVLAAVATIAGAAFLRRHTIGLVALTAIFGFAFRFAPETRLWNARLLPFFYLYLMFLAALGVTELVLAARRLLSLSHTRAAPARDDIGDEQTVDDIVARPARVVRLPRWVPEAVTAIVVVAAAVVAMVHSHDTRAFLPSWISWNETGYEAKPAYSEFRDVIETMGSLPPGRALWETGPANSHSINDYGTTLALELLPYFTHGRISSMEGLYFETSATTPYHFLTVAEVAKQPSNPMRGLTYHTISDFDLGVEHMQLMGVRYFMAASDDVTNADGTVTHGAKWYADRNPNLRFITETGSPQVPPKVARWRIYEVQNAPLVAPLAVEPVVLQGITPRTWLAPATQWFNDGTDLARPLVAGGPSAWARATPASARFVERKQLPAVTVTHVRTADDRVSFHVSKPGVPVLVKTSYFPNWTVRGARGPWRATPNFMVVVPTTTDVSLHFGRTGVDWLGLALSLLGLVGMAGLARWRLAPLPPRPVGAFESGEEYDEADDLRDEEVAALA